MAIRQSGARNAGTARLLEQRVRKDAEDGQPIAYDNAGVPHDAPGDDEGLFVKGMPFPSLEQGWASLLFSNEDPQPEGTLPVDTYAFLPALNVDGVRTVLVWADLEGISDEVLNSSFSLIPGTFLQGSTGSSESFFPLAFVEQPSQATDVTLNAPLGYLAKSRIVMPSEFHTESLQPQEVSRFVWAFDVSPYTTFTLAVADLRSDPAEIAQASSASFRYSYSM